MAKGSSGSDDKIQLQKSVSSFQHQISTIACIASFGLLAVELVADSLYFTYIQWSSYAVISQWIIILGVIIPNIIIFYNLEFFESNYHYLPWIYNFRNNIIAFGVISVLGEYGSPIWNNRNTGCIVVFYSIGNTMSVFQSFVINSPISLDIIQSCCYSLSRLYILQKLDNSSILWTDTTSFYLSGINYLLCGVSALILIFEGLLTRENILQMNSIREIEIKQDFIRYISHELRTPLNIVTIGLKCLSNDMIKFDHRQDWMDTIEDVERTIEMAVEVLNNLLIYEKLSTHALELDKKNIHAQRFIRQTIQPFYLQARDKGVELKVKHLYDTSTSTSTTGNEQIIVNITTTHIAKPCSTSTSNSTSNPPSNNNTTNEIRCIIRYCSAVISKFIRWGVNSVKVVSGGDFMSSDIEKGSSGSMSGSANIPNTLRIDVIDNGPGISP
eukprot:gene6598-13358_t